MNLASKSCCLLPYNHSQCLQDHSDPQTELKELISSDIELGTWNEKMKKTVKNAMNNFVSRIFHRVI